MDMLPLRGFLDCPKCNRKLSQLKQMNHQDVIKKYHDQKFTWMVARMFPNLVMLIRQARRTSIEDAVQYAGNNDVIYGPLLINIDVILVKQVVMLLYFICYICCGY